MQDRSWPKRPSITAPRANSLALIKSHELSAVEVMKAFLARIEEANPKLNVIVSLLPESEALKLAESADRAIAAGEPTGPLHGLPTAVKDLNAVKGFPTRFGSRAHLADPPCERDAGFVARIRRRGRAHHRQDQRARIRRRHADLQRRVRRHPQPLGSDPPRGRFERGRGGGGGGAAADRRRQRQRRLDPLSRFVLQHRRACARRRAACPSRR